MFYFIFQFIYLGIVTYGVSTAIESGMYNMCSTSNTIIFKRSQGLVQENNNILVKKIKISREWYEKTCLSYLQTVNHDLYIIQIKHFLKYVEITLVSFLFFSFGCTYLAVCGDFVNL